MFQSTHPRGVRQEGCISYHAMRQFQSTHPRGVRHAIFGHISFTIRVSIHAPTRGATHSIASILSISLFQSTHPRGVRLFVLANSLTPQGFNPRTHEGCDQRREVTISRFLRFNPRTHEGCDCKNTQCKQTQQVSIHAPTRGATSVADEIATAKDVSIHAPTRGATR